MSNYTVQSDGAQDKEMERLDDLHDSITRYFGGRLSLAPLENCSPSSILELGSGSGAWAIQAARQFPDAQVTAVDMAKLPDRPLPPNFTFKNLDLTKPLPFEPASFNIVHARLVMMHLPNSLDIIRQVIDYIKPGGWFLIEEPDDNCFWDNGGPPGPNVRALLGAWHRSMRERGAEPCLGGILEAKLLSSGSFSEVNTHYVDIPLSGQSSNPTENQLGAGWQRTTLRIIPMIREILLAQGITPEIIEGTLTELKDPNRRLTTRMYFTWSKKA